MSSIILRIQLKMIVNMGLHECDSFDEQDIDELQRQLQHLQGPSLKHFQILQQQSPITTFASQDIIKSLLDQDGKDLKFIGKDAHANFRAFFYVLLLLGVEEKKYYPHLNTLIRQQFYKPNIFRTTDQGRANSDSKQLLEKSLKYFQQISQGTRLEEYIIKEPLFTDAGVIMLRNSVQEEDERGLVEQLVAKFNIDLHVLRRQAESEVLQLGSNKRFHIFREGEYYFIGTTEQKEDLGQSRLDIESVRSGESGLLLIPQHSDQSTPKFKNSQVKFRKKSHKNSFGGDLEVVQYRDLLHLQSQKLMSKPKVLSEFYDVNDVQSCADTKFQAEPKKHTFQDIIDGEDANIVKPQMKGSTTIEPYQHLAQRRKDRKISASEIIEYKDFSNRLHRHDSLPQPPTTDNEDKSNSYSSLVVVKQQTHPTTKMRTSLITQGPLERIEQRQSSQRESTHPDAQSEHSDVQAQISVQNESQVKLKDRKYSYFTQQMASNKTKKQKQIEGSNYVFKIPKNSHKNSEYIQPGGQEFGLHYRRFQENPLRFSQLGAPSEQSAFDSAVQHYQLSRQKQLKINSAMYSYSVKFQPQNWFKKEVIYHLPGNQKEILVFERTYPLPSSGSEPCPAPVSPKQNYYAQNLPEPQAYHPTSVIRDSFGSSNSMLSQIQMKQPHTHSIKNESSQISKSYNPFQLNETSFLKQRIQSMVNLQPVQPDHPTDDSKSIYFASSRSMKEIKPEREIGKSPIKINFNYAPSSSTLPSSPISAISPINAISANTSSTMIRRVQHSEPLQFRTVQAIKSPTHISGFGSAQREVVFGQGQDRFFKSPLR